MSTERQIAIIKATGYHEIFKDNRVNFPYLFEQLEHDWYDFCQHPEDFRADGIVVACVRQYLDKYYWNILDALSVTADQF